MSFRIHLRMGTLGRAFTAAFLCLGSAGAAASESSVWERDKLTGDWGGARTALERRGIDVGIEYIGETLGILSGGLRRGTAFEGRLGVSVDTDLEKFMGWKGARTHVKVFQIHNANGQNAADYVGSLADPSNIDALRTTRLFTAWFAQEFGDFASIAIGQLAADDYYLSGRTAGGLINGTFGWATIASANLPSGGPAYPLATPGVRLKINPTENFSLAVAALSGDPAGKGCYDNNPDANPQACNRHGTTFSFSGGTLWAFGLDYEVNQGKDATGLAAAYKLGGWYHTGKFADQRFGVDGAGNVVALALDPGNPLNHRGNWGIYGVIDQMLWRSGPASISVFTRAGLAPSDRNLVSWYVDGGIGFKGLLAGRPDDTLTFGVAHSHISKNAAALDRDTLALNGPPYPIRSGETVFELSYIAQITPWWTIQPDVQYIVRPGGNVPDPADPTRSIENAFLIGARTTLTF
jgi:porin